MRLGHVALRVGDIGRSRAFYQNVLGMRVVWEPDPDHLYLSLGEDNLALHQIPKGQSLENRETQTTSLDHIGFIVDRKEDVDRLAKRIEDFGVLIVRPVRLHRDGSYSFYIEDPERNLIQILYEPHITKPTSMHPRSVPSHPSYAPSSSSPEGKES